jgi:hypothetical protein
MAITLDSTTLKPIAAASPATVAAYVAPPVIVADPSSNPRRDPKNDRSKDDSGLNFRAVLNANTFAGITGRSWQPDTARSDAPARQARVPKDGPTELNGSDVLLEAVSTTRADVSPGARVHGEATSRYAQAFFATTRTFARRGESLELTA